MEYKTILNRIQGANFNIEYEHLTNAVRVEKHIGGLLIAFMVTYEQRIKDYRPATYEQPEEGIIEFEPIDVCDIELYINGRTIELTDAQYDEIEKTLNQKII